VFVVGGTSVPTVSPFSVRFGPMSQRTSAEPANGKLGIAGIA
jgi:hypothetical protein